MTRFPVIAALFAPIIAAGQQVAESATEVLGRPDIVTQAESGPIISYLDILKLTLAVAVVALIMKFALPAVMRKMGGRLAPGVGSSIKIEESATIANGNLYVVSVRGKTLLLAAATSGVTLLTDLTEGERKEQQALADNPAFFEVLDANSKKQEESKEEEGSENKIWFAVSESEAAQGIAEVDADSVSDEREALEPQEPHEAQPHPMEPNEPKEEEYVVETESDDNQIDLEQAKELLLAAKKRIGLNEGAPKAPLGSNNFASRSKPKAEDDPPKRKLTPEEALARLEKLTR